MSMLIFANSCNRTGKIKKKLKNFLIKNSRAILEAGQKGRKSNNFSSFHWARDPSHIISRSRQRRRSRKEKKRLLVEYRTGHSNPNYIKDSWTE